ncbi:phage protein GemA/Gp16 family protein [Desulfobacter vibrioformis]|uniref:phage protein GemA/Gp16 family protein n=1 Tax=Desulfobacter vibrioformis TaxID=34031 RepID=UPI000550092F|nr:phage protein GemA/Gp16 family protein [Desulfobacter vibrioformis]
MDKNNLESSRKQRQLIAIACGQLDIGKVDKKVMLMTRYDVSSTTDLTYAQAEELIDELVKKGFAIVSDKRPYVRRQRPVRAAHEKQPGKMVALASPAELSKIDALAGLISWRVENGMTRWMKKRFKISKVKTSHDAFVVIEGLKGMFENQMKKKHGPDWWMAPHEDIEVRFYIAEHFPQ